MNQFIKVGVALSSLAIFAVSAFAGSVTGTWHGRVRIDATKVTQPKPEQRTAMMSRINKAQSLTYTLTLNANHTFTMGAVGLPTQSGTWNQAGNTVALQGQMNGKNVGEPQVFTLGKNEKVLSMTQKDKMTKKDAVFVTFSR